MGTLPLIKGDMHLSPKKFPKRGGGIVFFLFGIFAIISPLHAVTITGFVRDWAENPIENVEIYLQGVGPVQDVTGPTGAYTIAGLASGGTYYTYPLKAGVVFTPSSHTYTNLTTDQSDQNFIFGKVWGGGGADNLASNPNNWVGGEAPIANDIVLFSSTAPGKACFWDLSVLITTFSIAVDYSSAVVAVTDMNINNLNIAGGQLLFGGYDHSVFGNFNQTGGTFTFTTEGRLNFEGSAPQTLRMVVSDLGSGTYGSFFGWVWVMGSSSLTLASDMIVDGALIVTNGMTFNMGNSTLTLTGGRLTESGAGSSFNWDDSLGTFNPGTGMVHFFNHPRSYRIKQGAANSFNHLIIDGDGAVDTISTLKILGNLEIGQTARTSQLNIGGSNQIEVYGTAMIGPILNPTANAMTIGSGNAIFHGDITLGTATLSLTNTNLSFQGSLFKVTRQGVLGLQSGTLATLNFFNSSSFQLEGGTFVSNCPAVIQSTAPGTTRFSMQLNGAVDIRQAMTLSSLDANGMRFGVGSHPMNLTSLGFTNGITGGAALNFDPVTIASITVSNPAFDSSISTNVRAILNTGILPNASVNIIDPTGAHNTFEYENDPDNIINWGVLGTPSNFSGTTVGVSSISWNWTIANHPIGFIVKSSTGGNMSITLAPNTTFWIETGLSTNTQYSRYVEAFVDIGSATSNSTSKYTFAAPVSSASFTNVFITSITVSWNPNTNPSNTIFRVYRSLNGTDFTAVTTGTFASIHPFTDTGLTQFTPYYYRIRAVNGNDVVTTQAITITTTTLQVPPPVISAITPDIAANLGTFSFVVRGANFQSGATLVLQRSPTQIITPTSLALLNSSTFTCTFNLLGAYATTWDVFVENPDGSMSSGSGEDFLTITNAVSQGNITIRDYVSTLPLNFFTTDLKTEVRVPAGAMGDGRFYVSVDPVSEPLLTSQTTITNANANLTGWVLIPGTLREAVAFEPTGLHSGTFNQELSLAIYYPDTNNDGIVDSINIRASNLSMMTISPATGRWQAIPGTTLDKPNRRLVAPVDHFSLFALFGSLAASDLSEVKIYPNPWKPRSGTIFDANAVTISGLTQEGKIRIYTLDAQLVRQIEYSISSSGTATWDGKNGQGANVASGVYLIHIESGTGDKKTFKLGIER